jgi:hypothetical protein
MLVLPQSIIIQRSLDKYRDSLPESNIEYLFLQNKWNKKDVDSLIFLFEIIAERSPGLFFLHWRNEGFYRNLYASEFCRRSGCQRLFLTEKFWETRDSHLAGDPIFIKF